MEPDELDRELEELETRVERLRALYEQYFLGIEKIEPQVAKKDVERRVWRLRREQIRNTGKRFRLQTIIQRYNTFQQYWMRICREIEAGTYTRHLARAKRIMADAEPVTIAARKRLRAHKKALDKLDEEEATRRERADLASRELEDLAGLIDQPGALDSAMASVEQLLSAAPPPPSSRRPDPRSPASRRPRRSRGGKLDALELELDDVQGRIQPSAAPPGPAAAPPTPPERHPSGRGAGPPFRGSLPARPMPPPKPSAGLQPPGPSRPGSGSPGASPPGSPRIPPPGRAGTPQAPMGVQPPARGGEPVGRPPAPTTSDPRRPPQPGQRGQPPPGAGRRPTSAGQRAPGPPPRPGELPARATAGPRPVKPPQEARPAAPQRLPAVSGPPHPFSGGRAPARKSGEGLSDNRVRELHSKLAEAKRQTNDRSAVSVEGLRKSLESAEAKLRSKHGAHRKVEFDVVIKDGKAVVKPVVR